MTPREFKGPDDVNLHKDGGYSILSHVWEGEEQSFLDVKALMSPTASTPRSRASPKIRNCCELAEKQGYRWVWIDTCCINKESSAELSEAINSMFQWYLKAAVCYAYLYDYPRDDADPATLDSLPRLHESRWFSRGWTLQELIAPRSLLFVDKSWTIFGNRTSLVADIERMTRINADVLLHRRELGQVSLAERMSWASRRETTREEDEAYCLMGIFGINMPTIYGEGRAAFYRLQEEIMKISSDQTLFTWKNESRFLSLPNIVSTVTHKHRHELRDISQYFSYLLASSPQQFWFANTVEPLLITDAMKTAEEVCNTMTSTGILHFESNLKVLFVIESIICHTKCLSSRLGQQVVMGPH